MKTVKLAGFGGMAGDKCYLCGGDCHFQVDTGNGRCTPACLKCVDPGLGPIGTLCQVLNRNNDYLMAVDAIRLLRNNLDQKHQDAAYNLFCFFVEDLDLKEQQIKDFARDCGFPIAEIVSLVKEEPNLGKTPGNMTSSEFERLGEKLSIGLMDDGAIDNELYLTSEFYD